jgi:hypothetical protein
VLLVFVSQLFLYSCVFFHNGLYPLAFNLVSFCFGLQKLQVSFSLLLVELCFGSSSVSPVSVFFVSSSECYVWSSNFCTFQFSPF